MVKVIERLNKRTKQIMLAVRNLQIPHVSVLSSTDLSRAVSQVTMQSVGSDDPYISYSEIIKSPKIDFQKEFQLLDVSFTSTSCLFA